MDPQVREFMQRIVWSLSSALLWLMINAVAGLKYELALFDAAHTWGTIFFYCWLVSSFVALLFLFRRWWKSHL
jgi:hypothetical protein